MIIDEIEDSKLLSKHLCHSMRMRYKNMKKDNTGTSLWRKYEAELWELRNFSKKIPGVGSLLELPSGSNQLKRMKIPLVEKLRCEKHPVMSCSAIAHCAGMFVLGGKMLCLIQSRWRS